MSEGDRQLHALCAWNNRIVGEKSALVAELARARERIRDFEAENAQLRVEGEAQEALLGAAMDAAAERGRT
jgi:hypothetical protein